MPISLHQTKEIKTGLTIKTYNYEEDDDYCSDDERDAYACTDECTEQQRQQTSSREQQERQIRPSRQ